MMKVSSDCAFIRLCFHHAKVYTTASSAGPALPTSLGSTQRQTDQNTTSLFARDFMFAPGCLLDWQTGHAIQSIVA